MSTTSLTTTQPTSDSTPPESGKSLTPIRRTERGIQLATFDDAVRFSRAVVLSKWAPQGFDSAEKVFVAIQYGAEIGLTPMQSLQSIAVINGRPCLWGDALVALVRGSGKCEFIDEDFTGEPGTDDYTAICKVGRDGRVIERTFSIGDARAAGLLGKAGPWKNYLRRMLQVRARTWALRDAFADVLCGFQSAEEQADIVVEERRVVIDQPNDANYCALISTLKDKCGCETPDDNNRVVRTVSQYGGLEAIKDDEAACGQVLKALEGRHDTVLAQARS